MKCIPQRYARVEIIFALKWLRLSMQPPLLHPPNTPTYPNTPPQALYLINLLLH